MDPAPIRHTGDARPEARIQREMIKYLEHRGWYVKILNASTYMTGLPDLLCSHPRYGIRLVEMKDPERRGDMFTAAQRKEFPKLCQHGAPVIVCDRVDEWSYKEIIENKANWMRFDAHFGHGRKGGR